MPVDWARNWGNFSQNSPIPSALRSVKSQVAPINGEMQFRLRRPSTHEYGRHFRQRPLAGWVLVVFVALIGSLLSSLPVFNAPRPAVAAPASWVQSTGTSAAPAGATITQAFGSNLTAGNTVIVAASWGSAVPIACTDTQGNVYTTVQHAFDSTNTKSIGICYANNVAGGADTVTVTLSQGTATNRRIIVSEYANVADYNPLDVTTGTSGAGTTTADAVSSGSATTTSDGDLIFGAVEDAAGTTSISPGTGFTERASVLSEELQVQDKIQTSAGPVASTHTFAVAHRYASAMVAFRSQAASVATPPAAAGDGIGFRGDTADWYAGTAESMLYNSAGNSLASVPAHGGMAVSSIIRTSPNKREAIAAWQNWYGDVFVGCFDGTAWSVDFVAASLSLGDVRSFDVAYETSTGDALVAYSNTGTTTSIAYRTKPGTAGCGAVNWSSASTLDPARSGAEVYWIKLASDRRATSSLVGMAFGDDAGALSAMIWSGSAFTNEPAAALEPTGTGLFAISYQLDTDVFDLDWESTGDLMVVWGNNTGASGTNGAYYAACTGGTSACTWSAPARIGGATGDDAANVDISANPLTDEIVYASVSYAASDLQVGYWSGSAWTLVANQDTTTRTPATGTQMVATGYLVHGDDARSIVAYADATIGDVRYYVGNGPTFTTADSPLTYEITNTGALRSLSISADPIYRDRMMLTMADVNDVGWMKQATLDGSGVFNWTSPDNDTAMSYLPQSVAQPMSFAYWNNTSLPQLTQNGYIFENDDEDQAGADYVDENTQQAAGNGSLTSVKKGERVTARFQMSNTGAPLSSDLAVFYDRNDGIWSKVKQTSVPETAAGSCGASTLFDCSAIDTSAGVGYWSSMAVDRSGAPWIVHTDYTNSRLKVAHYVGSGGSGCATTAWSCSTIEASTLTGEYAHIAIDPAGNPWVSHYDSGNAALRVARYVSTGGTGCGATTAWSCELVDNSSNPGVQGTTIAFDSSGTAWMAYHANTAEDLRIARYVGTGGNCPSSTKWFCQTVHGTGNTGQWPSIAFDAQSRPWVTFNDVTNGQLWLARYVEAGGTGCSTNAQWTCGVVDTGGVNSAGAYSGIAFDQSGSAWISYKDWDGADLKIARYVGTGGSGCGGNAAWNCSTMDSSNDVGEFATIATDPSGRPWVAYSDETNLNLRVARYVGSGGTGCADSAWTCFNIETANDVGRGASIAFAPDGRAWISFLDSTNADLRVARMNRGGEITIAAGLGGTNGESLNETHTDMSSSTNSANRDDADCTTAGAYFNQGSWLENEDGRLVKLPGGTTTAQCTEVSFMLDTSQATAGTTYRFIVASKDALGAHGASWRGPSTVSNYATLAIEASTTVRAAKDAVYSPANCSTAPWSCVTVDSSSDVRPTRTGLAFDGSGSAWAAYQNATAGDIWVTQYVGSGGTGCASSQWTCYVVDSTNDLQYPSIATDPAGRPWMAYYDNTGKDMRVAQYVGSGGTGCASAAWTCTSVYTNNVTQSRVALAFDQTGAPVIAFGNSTSYLTVARPVSGNGVGSGCAVTTWQCDVVTSVATSQYALAVDSTGNAWISYRETTGNTMYVAHFVVNGGSGCAATSWTCLQVDSTSMAGSATSIAIGPNDVPWVAYRNDTSTKLRVATFTAGSGCATGTWTCTDVMTSTDSKDPSIAFDASGAAWISFNDETADDLWSARYVTSGGTGCASAAWSCSTIDTNNSGYATSLAFDRSGVPWISYVDYTGFDLKVAILQQSPTPGSYKSVNTVGLRNAAKGDARYPLDWGDVSRPLASTCDATAPYLGYCSVGADDTQYDAMTANANEAPVYTFASRSTSNTSFPSNSWVGRTNVAASTRAVKIEIFRFGSTNAWTTLSTNSTVAANTDFTMVGAASAGSASEYWQADGGNYWTYYRVWQAANSSSETLTTDRIITNTPPDVASSLAQKTTGDVVLSTGAWHNSTSVKFTGTVSDADNPDTLQLCVEAKPIASAFTNTEDSCGTGVAYSGSGVAASVTLTLTDAAQYHWQARVKDAAGAYSSWLSYGGNSDVVTAAVDVGIDTTAPGAGTVNDGLSAVSDAMYNDGSLTSLSATWTGFNTNVSGINRYEYTIGTTIGGTNVRTATSVATATTVTATGLTVHTGQMYYFRIFAYDNAGNVTTVDSNGQMVAPILTFTLSTNAIDFGKLNSSNSYISTRSATATVSTNANGGYQVLQRATGVLTANSSTLAMYSAPWSAPTTWSGTGFGYTSSDASVSGSNRFGTSTMYAGVSIGAADVIADFPSASPSGDVYTLGYKVESSPTQAAGSYSTSLHLSAVASF